jgi:catalase
MRVDGNFGSTKHYEPNSFNEWNDQPEFKEPPLAIHGDASAWDHRVDEDYYSQPGNLFRLMTDEKKQLLFKNTAAEVGQAQKFIQVRHIRNCYKADPAYGEGVAKALGLTMDEVNSFPLEKERAANIGLRMEEANHFI